METREKKPVQIGKITERVVERITDRRIRSYRLTCCEQEFRIVKIKPIKFAGKIVGMAREEIEQPAKDGGDAESTVRRASPSPKPPRERGDVDIGGE